MTTVVIKQGKFCSQGTFGNSRNIYHTCRGIRGETETSLASSGQRPGMLLNFLQCIGQPSTPKNYLTQNVTSTTVEKPCFSGSFIILLIKTRTLALRKVK